MSAIADKSTAEYQVLYGLTESQRFEFLARFNSAADKSWLIYALLAFLLGGFGAHRFYMREYVWGIVYLALCWTGIPWVFGVVEAFLAIDRIRLWRADLAGRIADEIRSGEAGESAIVQRGDELNPV